MNNRPDIPAEIKRKVLLEAGHRCAIPTCRYTESLELHHIEPYSKVKEHTAENIISLCPNCHRMAHDGKIDKKSLQIYKRNLRFTYDRFTQVEADLLFELYKGGDNILVPWNTTMLFLLRRLIDAKYINTRLAGGFALGGVDMSPVWVFLTEEGKKYMEEVCTERDESVHILY